MSKPFPDPIVTAGMAFLVWASMSLGACGSEFVSNRAAAGMGGNASNAGARDLGNGGSAHSGSAGLGAMSAGGAAGHFAAAGAEDESNAGAGDAAGAAGEAPGYEAVVLAERPVAYWRMGAVKRAVVADESGHGNDLVLQGTGHTLNAEGALRAVDDDRAIGFDGESSFAIASDARALDFAANSAFTLECWARRRSGGASYFQHLFSNVEGVAGDRNGYSLYLLPEPADNESARSVFEYDRPAADLGLWGNVAEESAWAHYVAVFDGTHAHFYVNGTLTESKAVSGPLLPRSVPFAVARSSGANDSFFKGSLDELAIYPRALGPKVIAEHFSFAK